MIVDRWIQTLMEQALMMQKRAFMYHNTLQRPLSNVIDYGCAGMTCMILQVLDEGFVGLKHTIKSSPDVLFIVTCEIKAIKWWEMDSGTIARQPECIFTAWELQVSVMYDVKGEF